MISKLNIHSPESKHPSLGGALDTSLTGGASLFNQMENEWVIIPEYSGHYEINKSGQVRSTLKRRKFTGRKPMGLILKQTISRAGYYQVALRNNGKQSGVFVHRLIAMVFIPNPENKPCVNHKNSIRTDNRVENLEWVTYSENNKHAYQFGFQKRTFGESHNQSILNNAQVAEIRLKYKKHIYTMPMLANEYNVSRGAIQAIISGKSWKTN